MLRPFLPSNGASVWKRLRLLLTTRPLVAFAIPILIALAVQAMLKRESEWLGVYVSAARAFLDGRDFYAANVGYLYPPFQVLLAVAFVPLPDLAARAVWYGVNVVALICLIGSAWRMAGGAELCGVAERRELVAFGIGLLCSGTYLLNALAHQQSDVIIAALVMSGCAGLMGGRTNAGSFLIGLGAAFKGPPLLLVAYLAFRRQWRAAALVVAVALAANFIPDLLSGAPEGGTWLQHWLQLYVLPTQRLDTPLGTWGSALIYNQSLGGTLQRLVSTALLWDQVDLSVVERRAIIGTVALKAIAYGIIFIMLVVTICAALRKRRMTANYGRPRSLPSQTAVEFGTVFILMLLISPMSGKAHFGILLLSAFALSRIAVLADRRSIWIFISFAALTGIIGNKDLVGNTVSTALLWGGTATWSAFALWIGCIITLGRGYAAPPLPAFAHSLFITRDRVVNKFAQ